MSSQEFIVIAHSFNWKRFPSFLRQRGEYHDCEGKEEKTRREVGVRSSIPHSSGRLAQTYLENHLEGKSKFIF